MEYLYIIFGVPIGMILQGLLVSWIEKSKSSAKIQALLERHSADRENLSADFEIERRKLYDKILKKNGFSPIHEEKTEVKPYVIESALNRNARLKKESEGNSIPLEKLNDN